MQESKYAYGEVTLTLNIDHYNQISSNEVQVNVSASSEDIPWTWIININTIQLALADALLDS